MNFSSDLFGLNSRSPAFSITIEGKDVTTALDARLHTVSPDNGFTTSLELEVKIDDLEIE
ncbi:hypothetical protein JYP58_001512 [Salmonella enterica subsp. enterica serovar Typhi]|nr:hypothetical protein [Salmonella enterica subsp. enterica serovar Typhi]